MDSIAVSFNYGAMNHIDSTLVENGDALHQTATVRPPRATLIEPSVTQDERLDVVMCRPLPTSPRLLCFQNTSQELIFQF